MTYTYDELDTMTFSIEAAIYDAERLNLSDPEEILANQDFIKEAEKLLERLRQQQRFYRAIQGPIMGLFLF